MASEIRIFQEGSILFTNTGSEFAGPALAAVLLLLICRRSERFGLCYANRRQQPFLCR